MNSIKRAAFKKDLQRLLNQHSLGADSDTPDFILAEYLTACLEAYNMASAEKSVWSTPLIDHRIDDSPF